MRWGIRSYLDIDPHTIPCKLRRHRVEYYAQLYRATPKWADTKAMAAIYRECRRRRDAGEKVVVDHRVPMKSKIVCGLHNQFNLCIITEVENIKKGNHTWPDSPYENLELFTNEQLQIPMHK